MHIKVCRLSGRYDEIAVSAHVKRLLICALLFVLPQWASAATPQLRPVNGASFAVAGIDWAKHGYVEHQYFLSGHADVLESTSAADSLSGHLARDNAADLAVRPAVVGKKLQSDRPYTTRIIVARPRAAEAFSGVVILEPLHPRGRPSAGVRLLPYLLAAGHAWVGVENPITFRKLRREQPEVFADLAIEHPSQLWGMLTQTAQLIRRSSLLDGPVRRIVMTGYSASGTVTSLYANSFGDRTFDGRPLIDGYLPLASGVFNHPIGVPIIRVMTQSDFALFGAAANRRDDAGTSTDRYRLIEVSGSTHSERVSDTCALYSMPENGFDNDVPINMVIGQALHNLIAWIDDGISPPRAPRMELNDGRIAVDEFGHAKGGLRLPHVEAPLSSLIAAAPGCELAGFRVPLEQARLRQLYPTAEDFVARRTAVAEKLAQERWISQEDALRIREAALKLSAVLENSERLRER